MAARRHTLVVADGDVDVALLLELATTAERPLLVAVDGGAGRVLEAGLRPDIVVGDFDSLSAAEAERLDVLAIERRVAERDKDESDMELGLLTALEAATTRITILGALGVVRPEHSVANLLKLADPRLDGLDVAIAGRGSRIRRIGTVDGPGSVDIEGESGDFVSLFPLDAAAEGVTTVGLRFGLADETLTLGPSRGLSNEILERRARVTTLRGRLLVIHTSRRMAEAPPVGVV